MVKSTCLLDLGINVKNTSLSVWEIVLHQMQQTCLAVPLQIPNSTHRPVEGNETKRRHRSFFYIFILLFLSPVIFTDIQITNSIDLASVEI